MPNKRNNDAMKKIIKECDLLERKKAKLMEQKEEMIKKFDFKISLIDESLSEYKPYIKKVEHLQKQQLDLEKSISNLFEKEQISKESLNEKAENQRENEALF